MANFERESRRPFHHNAGKGDKPRPVDKKQFNDNFDRAFSSCSAHPDFPGTMPPTADCIVCRRMFREWQLKGGE